MPATFLGIELLAIYPLNTIIWKAMMYLDFKYPTYVIKCFIHNSFYFVFFGLKMFILFEILLSYVITFLFHFY